MRSLMVTRACSSMYGTEPIMQLGPPAHVRH